MRRYLLALGNRDFRLLWTGATLSTVGDGMTFVALSWLVVSAPGGTARLGLLGILYTAPVLVGGLAIGPLLDRLDKRTVLVADSLVRAGAVSSVPVAAALGGVPAWLPYAVAACYGLLKMVPLAGFPAAIPQLLDDTALDAGNALESLSFSTASVVGPAAAGLLIGAVGAADVLLADAASFLAFALAVTLIRRPLRPEPVHGTARPSLAGLRRDRVIVATTIAFMAFNIAEGMLLVTAPWLARHRLPGGAAAYGTLLSATAAGEIVGAAVAGHRRASLAAIGGIQAAAALAFLALLTAPRQILVGAGFFAVGLLSAPMTVWAQSLRMRRIPAALHGRAFALLRTLMQATPPVGAALATPLLVAGRLGAAATTMTLLAGLPAVALLVLARRPEPAT
jgi:transmembrane secretion effector